MGNKEHLTSVFPLWFSHDGPKSLKKRPTNTNKNLTPIGSCRDLHICIRMQHVYKQRYQHAWSYMTCKHSCGGDASGCVRVAPRPHTQAGVGTVKSFAQDRAQNGKRTIHAKKTNVTIKFVCFINLTNKLS